MDIRFTLVGDGPFDSALMPVIFWVLRQSALAENFAGAFADPSRLPKLSAGLPARLAAAISLYPCNLLFVHRDAEGQGRSNRLSEIRSAAASISIRFVPIIPIRMTEAWLLVSDAAIRRAAGNPNGKVPLNLPAHQKLESMPDPKRELHQALLTASMLSGRQLRRFDQRASARRVAELIGDFSQLRNLSAFRAFEADLSETLRAC